MGLNTRKWNYMGFVWNLFHLVQTGRQTFCRLVSYESFKHVFHTSILCLLWCLSEVMVEVTVNRLNYCSCTKKGVYTVDGVIPRYWLPNLLWLFQIAKWKSSSAFLLPLDFSKQVINSPFTCTELPKSSYFMILIYFIILILKGSKLSYSQSDPRRWFVSFGSLKKPADLRITWQKSPLSSSKRLNLMDGNSNVAEWLAYCGLLLAFSRAHEILLKD